MTPGPGAPTALGFGPFVFDPNRRTLRRGDVPLRIGVRALDILAALVAHPGVLLSKRELMARVWPDTVVEDCNLKVNMGALRRALGDEPGMARYIATVTGRGYRFVAPVRSAGRPDSPPPSSPLATPRHNLPFAMTRIFGREDAIDAIRRDLDVARLLTIVGPGGIGKTTVALAVAEQALASHRDGVWLVDLTMLTDAALVPDTIASAVAAPAGAATPMAALCKALRDREILLVLDGCEHVIDVVATCVDQILSQAAGVKVLVTSREPLQLRGERLRRLPGLGTPPSSARLSADEALAFPAVQLFVDRAGDRLGSFRLRDAEAVAVAEICRRLDGLALAIEFAATRIDVFGVDALLRQLDVLPGLLAGGRSDGPERHRTLAATLDWSYGLLPATEASLLRDVSVFSGVFDVEGASAIARRPAIEVANALSELVAKSLLAVDVEGAGVAYRLLGTTRRYCLEKLHADGAEQVVRQRHAEHVCRALERAEGRSAQRGASEDVGMDGQMREDLRGALDWAVLDPASACLHVRLTVAGLRFWAPLPRSEESRAHVLRALEVLERTGMAGSVQERDLRAWLAGGLMSVGRLAPRGPGGEANGARGRRHRAPQSLLQTIGLHEGADAADPADPSNWAGPAGGPRR